MTNANAEDRDSFVSEKADDRGRDHRPQIGYPLGMQEPLDALISRDARARENRYDDRDPRQVLDASIAESKASAWLLACEPECDRERDCGGGVSKVMNGVREQR